MATFSQDEGVEWLRSYRQSHPEPVTVQGLLGIFREEFDVRLPRPQFKSWLRALPDSASWVQDLDLVPVVGDGKDLLERWVDDPTSRTDIERALRQSLERDGSTDPEGGSFNVARALGAVEGKPNWASIRTDSLPRAVRAAVIDAAFRQGVTGFVLDALCLSPTPVVKADRDSISASADEFVPAIEERLGLWAARSKSEPSSAEAMHRLVQLTTAIDDIRLIAGFLTAIAAAGVTSPTPKWIPAAVKRVTADPGMLQRCLDQLPGEPVGRLLESIASLPLDVGTPRAEIVKQVALSSHLELLAERRSWRGATVELLGSLTSQPDVGVRLTETVGDGVFQPIVAREAMTRPAWSVLSIARWPALAKYVTVEHLEAAAARSDAGAELIRALRDADRAALLAADADRLAELAAAKANADEAAARAEWAESEIERLRGEVTKQREVLAATSANKHTLLEAELNQGRIDALRVIIDIVERVRAMGALSDVRGAADAVVQDAMVALSGFGVLAGGAPGEIRPGDPALDETFSTTPLVEIVTPSYAFSDGVTVLRRAFVREAGGHTDHERPHTRD